MFSRTPLDSLVAALGPEASVHYVGRERRRCSAHFSLYSPRNADVAIKRLARLLMNLPRPARRLWNQASMRVFNIGYQGGFRPPSFESEISVDAVKAAARLGASITVTIYAAEQTSRPHSAPRPRTNQDRVAPRTSS
jgi:hypothetical protein